MIAAVLDPRGPTEARATLERMGTSWSDLRVRGNAVIASDGEKCADVTLLEPTSLEAAANVAHSGAFIAFDAGASDALLLARGSLGGRPLFHARTREGAIVASSRMAPILVAAGRSFAPDVDRLATLCVGVADPRVDATPHAGVERLAPCTALRLREGRSELCVRAVVPRTPLDAPVEELASELWTRFERSVRSAIKGASKVAVLVGGGVDSSALLATAVALARGASEREVCAIALDFDAEGCDRPYLDALAADLGIVPVRLEPSQGSRWYRDSFVLDAQPYTLTCGPLEQLMFRRARELGADVILSGTFGDELLAGDLRGFAAEAAAGSPIRAALAALRLRTPWPNTPRERLEYYLLRPLLKPLVPRRFLGRNGEAADAAMFPWAGPRLMEALRRLRERAAGLRAPRTPTDRFEHFLRWDNYADVADLRGQMEAATGIVRRDPYGDEAILDLVSRVRPSALSYGDFHRGLFREAIRGRVPEKIRTRLDKCMFEPAFTAVAEAAGGIDALGDSWDPKALERLGIVDAAAFRKAMAPLRRDPRSNADAGVAWSLATQVIACEHFARQLAGTS